MKSDQEASVTIGGLQMAKLFFRQTAGGSGLQDQRFSHLFFFFFFSGIGPLLHFVGSVCFVLLDNRQRVSLGVKDPVVEW